LLHGRRKVAWQDKKLVSGRAFLFWCPAIGADTVRAWVANVPATKNPALAGFRTSGAV